MPLLHQKYLLCSILCFCIACTAFAQGNTVTIIGDPVSEPSTNREDSRGGNPYVNTPTPDKDPELANPKTIEPTFENGFHIRYEIIEPQRQTDVRPANTGYEYASLERESGRSTIKTRRKRGITLTERSFNIKKRVKSWLPKRKKKYRPNVCGRF